MGMPQPHQIRYDLLIDRLIENFQPVKRLWPVGARLAIWLLLEMGVIVPFLLLRSRPDLSAQLHDVRYLLELLIFMFVGIVAAGLALRTAIPGREATRGELMLISTAAVVGIVLTLNEPAQTGIPLDHFTAAGPICVLYTSSEAALPWFALFWAVWRGVPLHPRTAGGLIGAAAFCFAFAVTRLVCPIDDSLTLLTWQLLPAALGTALSAFAGAAWLRRRSAAGRSETYLALRAALGVAESRGPSLRRLTWPGHWAPIMPARVLIPLALTAVVASSVIFLRNQREVTAPVPVFDFAIESYERALTTFNPNVPSDSLVTVLTAYIEDGMPPYLWDFGPVGYKLVGGRFEHLPDRRPVTYTLYSGNQGLIMCMFTVTDTIIPPPGTYREHRYYRFYRYKGYSICLSYYRSYGNYICVLVGGLPTEEFVQEVLRVAP
jgi:hypothetical protein